MKSFLPSTFCRPPIGFDLLPRPDSARVSRFPRIKDRSYQGYGPNWRSSAVSSCQCEPCRSRAAVIDDREHLHSLRSLSVGGTHLLQSVGVFLHSSCLKGSPTIERARLLRTVTSTRTRAKVGMFHSSLEKCSDRSYTVPLSNTIACLVRLKNARNGSEGSRSPFVL